jgi:hypothetical protein
MKIITATVILLLCLTVSLLGCSGGGSGNANADGIDTTTKVLASNVVLNNSSVDTSSSDLQSYLEEVEPILPGVFIGTWNTSSYGNGFAGETGSITLRSNGTFTMDNGVISLFGAAAFTLCGGSYTCGALAGKTGTWEVVKGVLLKLDLDEIAGLDSTFTQAVYAQIAVKNKTKLVASAQSTLSVWEKVQ